MICGRSQSFYQHNFPAPHRAQEYYAKKFADYRRKMPTPYMERLHFAPGDQSTADPDVRVLSDEDLKAAVEEGAARGKRTGSDALKV